MIQKFASIKLTFYLLLIIIALMSIGIGLSFFPEYKQAMKIMNNTVIYDWIKNTWHVTLTLWVIIIIFVSLLLFINTALCNIINQLAAAVKIGNFRAWSFFIIHILFLMVLFCHGITLITGNKQENINLCKNESYTFKNYTIKIKNIQFIDNPEFLKIKDFKKSKQVLTRKNFHIKQNFAQIILLKNNREISTQKAYFLKPMTYKSLRITITNFVTKTINKSKNADGVQNTNEKEELSVVLTITKNAFVPFFFTVYGFLIISLICFVVITWKPRI